MAKVKIIDSDSLEHLRWNLLNEIEDADAQIVSYDDELEQERSHRQKEETIIRLEAHKYNCSLRRDILHQCLCKIQSYVKEIEI